MGMLQTSLRVADGARHFNVSHTSILWLRHHLQEVETTWHHPSSGLHPETTPSQNWHIRLKHLWDQWRASTRIVAETTRRHNSRIYMQTMRNHLKRFTLRARIDDRIKAATWLVNGVLHGSTGWRYNTYPFSACWHSTSLDQMQSIHCPSQHNHRFVPHVASARYLTDCQIMSRQLLPQTAIQLCLVIPEVWDNIPQARITHRIPFMPQRCRVVHEAQGLSQPLLTLLHLTVCCTGQHATLNVCLANDDARQIGDLTHTSNFYGQFSHLLYFPLKSMCVSFFVRYTSIL